MEDLKSGNEGSITNLEEVWLSPNNNKGQVVGAAKGQRGLMYCSLRFSKINSLLLGQKIAYLLLDWGELVNQLALKPSSYTRLGKGEASNMFITGKPVKVK